MLIAEIKIKVEVDESKLTAEQQKHAKMADSDLLLDHPAILGCELMKAGLQLKGPRFFSYLGSGSEAITVTVED